MLLKKRLADEIVTQLYDEKEADVATKHFEKVVQKREVPEEIEEKHISFKKFGALSVDVAEGKTAKGVSIGHMFVALNLAKSRSEALRLIQQGAVSIDGERIKVSFASIKSGSIIKVGKRRFVKVINTDTIK